MFSTVLPIHLKENTDKHEILATVQRVQAECVLLSFDHIILSAERESYEKTLSIVRDVVPFLQSYGYKVGIYFWSLWLCDLGEEARKSEVMVSSTGVLRLAETALNSNESCPSGFLCPTSERIDAMLGIIRYAASLSPDLILLNDDLGYATYLNSVGCYCHRHMGRMEKRIGKKITREELRAAVVGGKRNEIREHWLAVQGESLEEYAKKIRETVDEVDPSIRVGFCCVMSNWEADGVSVERMAKLLAGNTRPMIRLIGAPYWATGKAWGNRLQHTVELSRMECAFVEDKSIECIVEGDVWPRPRYRVPASYLVLYDMAQRACGCADGIFKLMLDYASSFSYETGYVDRHVAHLELYREVERVFGDKRAVGVRVHSRMNKVLDTDFSDFEALEDAELFAKHAFFSYGARVLADNSVSTTYEGDGVGIAFGENARFLSEEELSSGLILDIRAARILMERGVDVGIERIGNAVKSNFLYFPKEDDRILAHYGKNVAYEIQPKAGARVLVYSVDGQTRYADTIEYENEKGQRFLVYAFDGALVDENRYRNYYTQRQLIDSLRHLGATLDAVCLGNPDLYVVTKKNEEGMAIGLFNMFADEIPSPVVTLAEEYSSVEFLKGDGVLEGKTLRLGTIPAYSFALLHLKK